MALEGPRLLPRNQARRVARYHEMQLILEDSRKRVTYCQTWNSLERIVLRTEGALREAML